MRESLPLFILFLSPLISSEDPSKALDASIRASDAFIEKPQLECQSSGLRLHLKPINNFTGHVYVRGFFNDKRCHLDYGDRPMSSPFYVDVPYLGECAVQKQRMADPAGIMFSVVVIAQKHRMLVTHGDRAFRLNCFYRQSETRLEHSLDVSDISPSPLDTPPVLPPSCHYDVLSSSMNGPKIRTATVGEPVIHRWTCDSKSTGFLVHSCLVRDPTGEKYRLVDERGCVTDRSLLSPLTYSEDLSVVFTTIPAFRFAEQLLVLFTCQITVCEKAENGCEGIAPPQCEQLSHDLPIKTEYKKHGPESQANQDLLPVREQIGGMKSAGEETYERDGIGRNEDGKEQKEKGKEEEDREKLKKKLIGSWTDEDDDNDDRIINFHGDSSTTTTTKPDTTTSRVITTSTTEIPLPSIHLPPLHPFHPLPSPSNESDQPSKLTDKFPTTYETGEKKGSMREDPTRVDSGSPTSTTTEEIPSKTTTTERPPEEQTYASLTVFPSSVHEVPTTESPTTSTEPVTEPARIALDRDENELYSTPSPSSSSTPSSTTSSSSSPPSTTEPFMGSWPMDPSPMTTIHPMEVTTETTSERPKTEEKATQTDEIGTIVDEKSGTGSSTSTEKSQSSSNSTTTAASEDAENGSSLYGGVPSPSSYISSPQEPFSANEEFSSSHVAEKMKAGPNTGNYDTSMGLSGLEQKKAQLVARANQKKPDMAVHTPSHEVRDNSQPLRRIEADRRPIQDASPQFSLDPPSESHSSRSSLATPIVAIVSSPLTRLPTDHPARNGQWSPPVWDSFPAPRQATIFRVGEKRLKRQIEKDGGRRKKRDEITVDVHADEILVLTSEEMALQKAQSDSNQIESRNLRQVSHDSRQREDEPRHNLTLARLLNSPMEERGGGDCVKNVVVPVVAILLIGAILQVLTCSALFSQRKRHSVQMKQLMNAHYS